jgi:hypothetical protein
MELKFKISDADADRLFAVLECEGSSLSANEFAKKILEAELYRRFPAKPRYDESGNLINVDKYRSN